MVNGAIRAVVSQWIPLNHSFFKARVAGSSLAALTIVLNKFEIGTFGIWVLQRCRLVQKAVPTAERSSDSPNAGITLLERHTQN